MPNENSDTPQISPLTRPYRRRRRYRREGETLERTNPVSWLRPLVNPFPAVYQSSSEPRPRHHYRRGAISEASGQPNILALGDDVVIIENFSQSISTRSQNFTDPISQRRVEDWRAFADQIRHHLVHNHSDEIVSRFDGSVDSLARTFRGQLVMEEGSRQLPYNPLRFGREGWWTVGEGEQPTTGQRQATVNGSSFTVPDSTLNLIQSVDLFAPPPPPLSLVQRALSVFRSVGAYHRGLEADFTDSVEARRRGGEVPSGKIFALSLELSKMRQMIHVLEEEYRDFARVVLSAESSESVSLRAEIGRGEARRRGQMPGQEHSWDLMFEDAERDILEVREGDLSNLVFAADGPFPQEVVFHVGSRQLSYQVEEVENWIMNRPGPQRHEPVRVDARLSTSEEDEESHEQPEAPRFLDTLALPEPIGRQRRRFDTFESRDDYPYAGSATWDDRGLGNEAQQSPPYLGIWSMMPESMDDDGGWDEEEEYEEEDEEEGREGWGGDYDEEEGEEEGREGWGGDYDEEEGEEEGREGWGGDYDEDSEVHSEENMDFDEEEITFPEDPFGDEEPEGMNGGDEEPREGPEDLDVREGEPQDELHTSQGRQQSMTMPEPHEDASDWGLIVSLTLERFVAIAASATATSTTVDDTRRLVLAHAYEQPAGYGVETAESQVSDVLETDAHAPIPGSEDPAHTVTGPARAQYTNEEEPSTVVAAWDVSDGPEPGAPDSTVLYSSTH